MSARHDNRDRQGPDTTPFFTYRRGAVVPDNSSGRTPIGSMTHEEIYGPALRQMPACGGDCQQMGGEHCPHPGACQADSKKLRRILVMCVAVWCAVGAGVYFLLGALS